MKHNSEKLEKENQQTRLISLLFIGLSLSVVIWLLFRPSAQKSPSLSSLEEKWNILEASAHNLQEDAYLTNVTFALGSASPYAITAEYHSTSVPDKTIFVGMDGSGRIDAKWVDLPPSSSGAQKPIQQEDWSIDSQASLSIFAQDDIVNTCLESSRGQNQLSLNRVMTENASWVLHVFDCPTEGKFATYYLDAQTGEIIDPFSP